MCATAECGPVGILSHNSTLTDFSSEHLKSISGQIGRLLDIYVCVLRLHSLSFGKKNTSGKDEPSFTISSIAVALRLCTLKIVMLSLELF